MVFVNGPGVVRRKIAPFKLVTFVDEQGHEIGSSEPSRQDQNQNQNQNQVSDHTIPPYFYCDINGYPYYCAQCDSIKPTRARHSNEIGKCVAKMDHFCVWIGSILGKQNYKNFMNFSVSFLLYFVYYFVVLLVYIPGQFKHRIKLENNYHSTTANSFGKKVTTYCNPNLLILLVLSFLWILILAGLVGQHLWYIARNETTIEHIKFNREKRRRRAAKVVGLNEVENTNSNDNAEKIYVNVLYHNNDRYVVEVSPMDLPFRKATFMKNFKEVYGTYNFLTWFLPFNFPQKNTSNRSNAIYSYFSQYKQKTNDVESPLVGSTPAAGAASTYTARSDSYNDSTINQQTPQRPHSDPSTQSSEKMAQFVPKSPRSELFQNEKTHVEKPMIDEKKYFGNGDGDYGKSSVYDNKDNWIFDERFSDSYLQLLYQKIENDEARLFQTRIVIKGRGA